jgi:hypothetical protein
MHALKHACGFPITFPSSIMHRRLAGKVLRLETVHSANNLTLLVRAMNVPTPLGEIIRIRIVATAHALSFPGPMLEVPWRVLLWCMGVDSMNAAASVGSSYIW